MIKITNPVKPHVIGVFATNLAEGDIVTITNLTRTSARVQTTVDSNKKIVIDLKNVMSSYVVGDVLLIETHGKQEGGASYTIAGGGKNQTLSTSASGAASISL